MTSLTFYTNPMSRGQIARWALEETGAEYEQVLLDYGTTMKGEEYLAINPMGKVPAIKHGDKVVTEAAAVCAYLADAFPEAGLAPTEDERADYYRWMFFAAGPLENGVMMHSIGWDPTEEQERMVGYGNYERTIDVLEGALTGRDYVCGDRFTMADVYLGSQVDWGVEFGTIPKRDTFEAYVERLRARDAYKRAKKIDNALIAEQQAQAKPEPAA
ncbi:glutathione S-transferase family protein [Parasphingopyxis algicola]|uniref:glutathione S-transferase family protein n=1 Tax=Parasphingopyxis algicola TaxID=2026624 RepID=UPI0015A15C21|nr:glutathione S-transferase family protein [Parasphingopyxis algicola]QLC23683.1 glutathione S-transferase family protein [Parasphingopyxis algicola]